MTEPEQPKQFGIDLQNIAIPVILAVVLVYFALPPYNDSELRQQNANLTARLDIIEQTKADASDTANQFASLIVAYGNLSSEASYLSHNFDSYGVRLNNSESRMLQCEQNTSDLHNALTSGLAVADAKIDNITGGLQDANAKLAVNMTAMQVAVNSIAVNQSDMRGAIDAIITVQNYSASNQTALNNSVQTSLNQQAIIQNRTDALNATTQNLARVYAILCAYNSSWC